MHPVQTLTRVLLSSNAPVWLIKPRKYALLSVTLAFWERAFVLISCVLSILFSLLAVSQLVLKETLCTILCHSGVIEVLR